MKMKITIADEEYEVQYTEDAKIIDKAVTAAVPKYITYDTETTGLHIHKDTPFLGAICWDGFVYVFPTTKEVLKHLPKWASRTKSQRTYCHNTTFDMSMTANIIGDAPVLGMEWGDTMGICRLIFESVSMSDGGDSLKLKVILKRYVDANADKYEKAVKSWLKAKESADRKVLIAMFRSIKWSLKRYQAALDGHEAIPQEVTDILNEWHKAYPKPTYKDVPMDIMLPYVAVDVIGTNILVRRGMPVVVEKGQQDIMKTEFKLLKVVFKMNRVGVKIDRDYLLECRSKIEMYMADLTIRMHDDAGRKFKVGQHKLVKEIYENRIGEKPKSTDKQFMNKQKANGDTLAPIIAKMRTLDKWLSTYVDRILEGSEWDGKFYTQLGQFNPVTGRFSGDFQQMPKEAVCMLDDDGGEELFHPRKCVLTSGGGYKRIYFQDFSQVELRVQAHYTLPFGGDLNLCRAYMPYKCAHYATGELYDNNTEEGKARWNELRHDFNLEEFRNECLTKYGKFENEMIYKAGWSAWRLPDSGNYWVPTDVHTMTTEKALPLLGIKRESLDKKSFERYRQIGKRFNFMRNYGGGNKKAAETLEITIEHAEAMNNGYTEAFPMVVDYQEAIVYQMTMKGYVKNASGRRYYINSARRFYKAANYIVQGSCGDDLKEKMLLVDEYVTKHKLKSRLLTCIHDELVTETWEGEEHHMAAIAAIMEYTPKIKVPIVVETSYTETNWADKISA